jgi:hypothetical protein
VEEREIGLGFFRLHFERRSAQVRLEEARRALLAQIFAFDLGSEDLVFAVFGPGLRDEFPFGPTQTAAHAFLLGADGEHLVFGKFETDGVRILERIEGGILGTRGEFRQQPAGFPSGEISRPEALDGRFAPKHVQQTLEFFGTAFVRSEDPTLESQRRGRALEKTRHRLLHRVHKGVVVLARDERRVGRKIAEILGLREERRQFFDGPFGKTAEGKHVVATIVGFPTEPVVIEDAEDLVGQSAFEQPDRVFLVLIRRLGCHSRQAPLSSTLTSGCPLATRPGLSRAIAGARRKSGRRLRDGSDRAPRDKRGDP